MKKRPRQECLVPRSMGLALWVSRLFGIAPLRIMGTRDGFLIRYSPSLCVIGYVIITVYLSITLIALGLDLSAGLEMSIRMRTETRRMVWISDVAVVSLLCCVGGYQAPAQMRRLIDYVIRVQKINSELRCTNGPKLTDNQLYRNVIIAMSMTIIIMVIDFGILLYVTVLENRRVWLAAIYICYYCSYIILQLLEIQFILTVMYVRSPLRIINYKLKTLQINQDKSGFQQTTINNCIPPYTIAVQPKSINKIVDTLAVINSLNRDETSEKLKTDARMIRHLSLSYNSVCKIIREVNNNHGVIILLLLASFLLHLIFTLYYMITYIIFDQAVKRFWQSFTTPLLQVVWTAFHTLDLVLIIEPCHKTHAEIELTRELVSFLMCTISSQHEPLATELELFFRNLMFNQVFYAPLQVCTLTRSLICTVLGSITTYLVVIIQL